MRRRALVLLLVGVVALLGAALLLLDAEQLAALAAAQHPLPAAARDGAAAHAPRYAALVGTRGVRLRDAYVRSVAARAGPYRARVHRALAHVPAAQRRAADVLVVGAGLSGAVVAERAAAAGQRVLVLERRAHAAGNCFDATLPGTALRVALYGAHLFHTDSARVWRYVQRFGAWRRWEHEVRARVGGALVPLPVNPTTVNMLVNASLASPAEMRAWLAAQDGARAGGRAANNSADVALQRVGRRLFELIFRPYTRKQWEREPAELNASVLARIPVHESFDTRYFTDRYQALPVDGYTALIDAMLDHPLITVALNTDYFEVERDIARRHTVYTGPIDRFFADQGLEALQYRSLEFEHVLLPYVHYFQPNSVVNYPGLEWNFTRIVEHKHFLHQESPHTVISFEYPSKNGEPYYPIPSPRNQALFDQYQALADNTTDVHFVGRLANYKYLNMDQAIARALDWFDGFEKTLQKQKK